MSNLLKMLSLLALVTPGGSAIAQDNPATGTEPPAPEVVQEEAAVAQGASAIPDAASAAAEDTDPDRAPDDYEASEQISEDLSVSFPVDI